MTLIIRVRINTLVNRDDDYAHTSQSSTSGFRHSFVDIYPRLSSISTVPFVLACSLKDRRQTGSPYEVSTSTRAHKTPEKCTTPVSPVVQIFAHAHPCDVTSHKAHQRDQPHQNTQSCLTVLPLLHRQQLGSQSLASGDLKDGHFIFLPRQR